LKFIDEGEGRIEVITIGEEFKEKYSFRETCFGIVIKDNEMLVLNKSN
jgi:hypothetical protein